MMDSKCDSYREKIAALALDDLSDAGRRELETHLDGCPHCRLEREGYAQTIRQLASVEDEPAPCHFFISPDQAVSPWGTFLKMPFRWRAAFAGVIVLALLLSGAALSRFQVRSNSEGWSVGFGTGDFDAAAYRKDFLQTITADRQKDRQQWMEEIRSELARLRADEDFKTKQMEERLIYLASGMDGRIARSEEQIRQDTQILVAILYQELEQRRTQDMEAIQFRLASAEIREAIKTQETNEVLGTLLQIAEMTFNY